MATFGTLSDRLADTFKNLRTKGKLSPADVDGTVREIRRALLDADVSLDVVKAFTATVRERALSDEVNRALNPAQQVVQIVNEELVGILGGQQRRLQFAKTPPTIIMLAGLQGAGKTTLAGKLAKWLRKDGHTPLLVAAASLVLSVVLPSPVAKFAFLCLAAGGILACQPVFWTLPASFMHGATAAAGIAIINSIGNLGGFIAQSVVPLIRDKTGSTLAPMFFLAGCLVVTSGLVLATQAALAKRRGAEAG